jgi:hypothetical protein
VKLTSEINDLEKLIRGEELKKARLLEKHEALRTQHEKLVSGTLALKAKRDNLVAGLATGNQKRPCGSQELSVFNQDYCKLCGERKIQVIFYSCGHIFACQECYEDMQMQGISYCLACFEPIHYKITINNAVTMPDKIEGSH